jgi:hypothetical protein
MAQRLQNNGDMPGCESGRREVLKGTTTECLHLLMVWSTSLHMSASSRVRYLGGLGILLHLKRRAIVQTGIETD